MNDPLGLYQTIGMLFIFLACFGINSILPAAEKR
jgi:hypothetical protein